MIRAHGIIGLLPVAAQRAFSARIAAGDHRPAIHDADKAPAALTAEAQPVFRSRRTAPARDPVLDAADLITANAGGDPQKARAFGALATALAVQRCEQ